MILTKPIVGQDYGPGFVGFCKTRSRGIMGNLSNVITWFECKEEEVDFEKALCESTPDAPSHVVICIGKDKCVDKEELEEMIIHAYAGGVQIAPLSMFLANPDVQMVFREPTDMAAKDVALIIEGAKSILGHPYNYLGLIGRGIVAGTPLHHWAWYMKKPLIINAIYRLLGLSEPYYCSAVGAHALKFDAKYLHTLLFDLMDESKIMPCNLYAGGPFKPLRFDKEK